MSSLSCAQVRDLAAELALGVSGGAERAEALEHLGGCAPCRSLVAELGETADALPFLVAEAEPPAGFEQRVLASLGGRRPRRAWRWAAVVAATAAASTIASVAMVRIVDRDRDEPVGPPVAAVTSVRNLPMRDGRGSLVGWAVVSDGRPAALGVSVAYVLPTGRYAVELRAGGRAPAALGHIDVVDGRGGWAGTATVPRSATALALVDADGGIVCRARL